MQSKLTNKKARKDVLIKIENVSEGPGKAKCNHMNIETFLKMCVKEFEACNRSLTHFTK